MDALVAILAIVFIYWSNKKIHAYTIPFPNLGPCSPGIVPELTPLDSYSSLYITWSIPDISDLTTYNFIETYEVQLTLQNPEAVKIMQVTDPGLELNECKSGEMIFVSVRAKCSCGNFGLQKTLRHLISKCDTYMYMCVLCTKVGKLLDCPVQMLDLNFVHSVSSLVQAHTRCGVCEVYDHWSL